MELFAEQAYLFRHAAVRDAAYQLQPPAERARLHRLALQILETLPGMNLGPAGLELRDHARLARMGAWPVDVAAELAEAERKYLRLGADHARFNYDYATSLAGFRELIELLGDDPHKAAMAADSLADVYQRLGRWQEARDCFIRVQRDCREREYVGRALLHLAWMDLDSGQTAQAEQWAAECEKAAEDTDSYRLRIALLMLRARQSLHAGDADGALAFQESAIKLAVEKGDGVQEMIGHGNAAEIEIKRGDLGSARRHSERALELAHGPRMLHHRAALLASCAHIALQQAEWDSAALLAGDALELARRTGSRALEGAARVAVVNALGGLGQFEAALKSLVPVHEIWAETGDRVLEHSYYIAWAGAMHGLGRGAEAVSEVEGAITRLTGQVHAGLIAELKESLRACRGG